MDILGPQSTGCNNPFHSLIEFRRRPMMSLKEKQIKGGYAFKKGGGGD